jgi:hypothetical protein
MERAPHHRQRRDRRSGATYLQGLGLLALAIGSLLVLLLLAATIHTKYRCAADVVAGGGAGAGCGGASSRVDTTPVAPRASRADPPPVGSSQSHAAMAFETVTTVVRPRPSFARGTPEHAAVVERITSQTAEADAMDVAWVKDKLQELPLESLQAIERAGVRVVVAHERVTEQFSDLAGVRIGFGTYTYDDPNVGGLYRQGEDLGRIIVIPAATAQGMPDHPVEHEVGHALDYAAADARGTPSSRRDRAFIQARLADIALLPEYQRAAAIGAGETYAQSFADYLAGNSVRWPHLGAYWDCALASRCKPDGRPLDPPLSDLVRAHTNRQVAVARKWIQRGRSAWDWLRGAPQPGL